MGVKSCMKTIGLLVCVLGFVNVGFCQYIWGPDTRLTYDDSLSYFGFPTLWAIAADTSGRVHVVWYDQRDPQWASEVYYKRSTDNGTTWESDVPLTTNSSYWQEGPCVVTDRQGRVHVVYTEFECPGGLFYPVVHYKRSTDGGVSWGPEIDIAYLLGDFAGHTSLATDLGNYVYVLYANQTGASWAELDNFFVRSTNGGQSWGSGIRLTSSRTALWGSVAADTLGRVHVVYVEALTGARQLYYRRSTNYGQSFEPAVELTTASSNKGNVSIYTDRGNMVHVVWEDSRHGNYEIYYIRSTDGGSSWGPEIRMTADPDTSREPNIVADLNGGVYLVWTDNRPDKEVYFKYSTNGGNTWSNDTCLTEGAVPHYGQFFPNIACTDSGNYLHIAWQDQRDGNLEVYYKRGFIEHGIQEHTQQQVSSNIKIFPNPFKEKTVIQYALSTMHYAPSLSIYDATGRLVRQWDYQTMRQGNPVIWTGTDDTGHKLPVGVYFCHLQVGAMMEVRKLVMIEQGYFYRV